MKMANGADDRNELAKDTCTSPGWVPDKVYLWGKTREKCLNASIEAQRECKLTDHEMAQLLYSIAREYDDCAHISSKLSWEKFDGDDDATDKSDNA